MTQFNLFRILTLISGVTGIAIASVHIYIRHTRPLAIPTHETFNPALVCWLLTTFFAWMAIRSRNRELSTQDK